MKKVYGVGINQKGAYNSYRDEKAYKLWKSILQRCYSEKSLVKFPTYRGCKVCDEWIYFQNFASWFYKNYVEGFTIDKDILGDGKLYSPETCCFVPNHINNILNENKKRNKGLPIGVRIQDDKFRVIISVKNRKKISVGYFDNKYEAAKAYINAKKDYVEKMAREYELSDEITNALITKLIAA
jgi:hypothetical protein